MLRHRSRPKSQPPIRLSDMVTFNKRKQEQNLQQQQHQQVNDITAKNRAGEEEQHWSKMIEKYEKSRSLRFSRPRNGLKTLSEHQAIGGGNDNSDLDQDEPDISPLTSSDSSSSSSSGGSSLASSTLSLSSVSSASTVMAVDEKRQQAATNNHNHKKHHDNHLKPFKPSESIKNSLGSDEESSSNSSSCSSSSGISSIGRTTTTTILEASSQVVAPDGQNKALTSANCELERAVAESLEALVSSVVASQNELAFDVLMVKEMPINVESLSTFDANNNLSGASRDIVSTARRCIFNALTHAQKVGRREAGWRIELHLSEFDSTNQTDCDHYIRWFKQDDEGEANETIVLAEHIIDCLVEHELVIWLIRPNDEISANENRLQKSIWVATASSSSSKKLLINERAHGPNKLDAEQAVASRQLARLPPSNQSASSQVCGNLIGITADCDSDQQQQTAQRQSQVDSVIWLCSNELEAEKVQEAWIKFNKWCANYSTAVALDDGKSQTRMVAIKLADSRECSNEGGGGNLLESSGAIYDRISVHDNLPAGSVEVARGLTERVQDADVDVDQEPDSKCYSSDDCDELDQVEEFEGLVSLAVDQRDHSDTSYEPINSSHGRGRCQLEEVETSTGGQKTDAEAVKVADAATLTRSVKSVSRIMTMHSIDAAECGHNELEGSFAKRLVEGADQQTTVLANTKSSRPTLRKTISVFNLTSVGRSSDDSMNHIERLHELSFEGITKAPSQVSVAFGDDSGELTAPAARSKSSKIIRSSDEERAGVRHRSRLASNQVVEQQQQRTMLKVSSVCDLSSSGQRQQQFASKSPRQVTARPTSPSNKLASSSKQTPNGHPQLRASIASGVSTTAAAAAAAVTPVVKPRTSVLKRQAASGGGGKEEKARPPSQLVTSINKQTTTRTGIPHDGNEEYETNINGNKCDLQRNIDPNRTDCSGRAVQSHGNRLLAHGQNKQQHCFESGSLESGSSARSAARLVKGESIDQLNEPFKCSSQSSVGSMANGKRRSVGAPDSCAQVVVVSSPVASSRMTTTTTTKSKVVATDEHLAPKEITPIARDVQSSSRSSESQGIKLDNQPRRLLIGSGKINSQSRQQQQQQKQSREVCDESQLNRQPVVRQRLVKTSSQAANGNVDGNSNGSSGTKHSEQLATVNQSKTATAIRRKAVHSLANCELLARHHHNQQLLSAARATNEVLKTNGNSVTIRILNGNREQKSEVSEDDENDNELDFVSSGSVAREQAFERLRQRASCYDITRLMSKNSIIQSQLARLRATGPSRDSLSASNNDLRQRKPAELLVVEPESPSGKNEERTPASQPVNKRDSTITSKRINHADDEQTGIVQKTCKSKPGDEMPSVRSGKSKVPVGGVAVLRHQELDVEATRKEVPVANREELIDVESDANGEDQSTVSDEESDETKAKQENFEVEEEEENEKKVSQTKSAGTSGLSKFNLLRQSFNQKTISSMLKFSSRASLRIKTSKPVEKVHYDKQETSGEIKEREVTVAAAKQVASKTISKVDQQQQQQIAALDSATLMLYNRQLQQRQQRQQQELIQQQQQQQYALQWQQHQIYIQQQQQQQRQQLAFMANHYVTTHHQHQMLASAGVPMAMGGYSSAASSMYAAQQLMMMQQHQSIQQPIAAKVSSSNMVGNILRKSILKQPKSVVSKQDVQVGRMVYGAHHYAPSQQQHGHMVPLEVNHHSSFNIVYGAESTAQPNYNHNNHPYELNELLVDKQKVKPSVPTGHNLSASSLKASMRRTVKSILVNRTASDDQKKVDEKQRQQQQPQKPLKSALKSSIKRTESTLNLNSDGSDGDHSNSSTLESSSSSSDRNVEPPTQLKSALKKSSGMNQDENKLVPILSNTDDSGTSSNSSDTSFKRAISARCSRRLTIKAPVKTQEPQTDTRVSIKPMKKNVTFSTKLTSIQ